MHIGAYSPSGYFATADANGKHIEGETRQCAHCQYTWEFVPGSGITRAVCLSCLGLKCCRPECEALQRRMLARFPGLSGGTRHCIPFNDFNNRLLEEYAKDKRFEVLPSGIVVQVM